MNKERSGSHIKFFEKEIDSNNLAFAGLLTIGVSLSLSCFSLAVGAAGFLVWVFDDYVRLL